MSGSCAAPPGRPNRKSTGAMSCKPASKVPRTVRELRCQSHFATPTVMGAFPASVLAERIRRVSVHRTGDD
jgi:hypothetical protein